jgi:predicted dehydrogenase
MALVDHGDHVEATFENGVHVSVDALVGADGIHSTVEARFPGGAVSHCGASYNSAPVGYFRDIAERGWFALDPAFNYQGIEGLRSDGKAMDYPPINQFATEMDDFARCILENTPSRVSGEEGLRDVRLMMAIYESARSDRRVELTSS